MDEDAGRGEAGEGAGRGEQHDPSEQGGAAWWRSGSDRYLGGVAGGMAQRFAVDPLVFRVGFAVATLWWRVTPLVYAALWLCVREEGAERSLLRSVREPGGLRRAGGIAALGLGAYALAPGFRGHDIGEAQLGLVLLVAGAVLIMGRWGEPGIDGRLAGLVPSIPRRPVDPGRAGSPTASGSPSEGSLAEGSGLSGEGPDSRTEGSEPPTEDGPVSAAGGRAPATAGGGPLWRRPFLTRSERRPPARLGWFGIWLLVLTVGGATALDWLDVRIAPGVVVSILLFNLAVVLLVGSVWGRARILILPGLVLAPLWLGFAVGAVPRYDGEGQVSYRPATLGELQRRYTHGYGELVLDLTDVDFGGRDATDIDLGLTAGVIEVRTPREVDVRVSTEAGVGHVQIDHVWEGDYGHQLLDEVDSGWPIHGRLSTVDMPARGPTCEQFFSSPYDDPYPYDDLPDRRPDRLPGPQEEERLVYEDPDARPCTPQPDPTDPPVVRLDVRLGIGTVEVRHVETPA